MQTDALHVSDYGWEKIPDYALLGFVLKNTTATNAEGCKLRCLATTWCRSINFYPIQSRCELNTKAWGDDETALNFVLNDSVAEYYYYCTRENGIVYIASTRRNNNFITKSKRRRDVVLA